MTRTSLAPANPSAASLSLLALGVVYGDIGTSPLYAVKETFNPEHGIALNEANKRVPAALSAVVMHCLEKNPADRYARAFELADALVAFLASAPNAREHHRLARVARLAKGA